MPTDGQPRHDAHRPFYGQWAVPQLILLFFMEPNRVQSRMQTHWSTMIDNGTIASWFRICGVVVA